MATVSDNESPVLDIDNAAPTHPAKRACMLRKSIYGEATDFLIEPFADRIVILITQRDKLGTTVI